MKSAINGLLYATSLIAILNAHSVLAETPEGSRFLTTDHGMYLLNASGSNYVLVKAPDALSSSYDFTLPSSAGFASEVLSTDGLGNLSWVPSLSDPMTTIGDMVYRNGSNATDRFAVGAANTVVVGGTVPSYSKIDSPSYFTSGAAVQPGTAAGIVPSSGLPGKSDGVAVTSGTVGEIKSANSAGVALTAGVQNVTSVTLTPGVWLVSAQLGFLSGTSVPSAIGLFQFGISKTSAAFDSLNSGGVFTTYGFGSLIVANGSGIYPVSNRYVNISVNTTIYLVSQLNCSATNGATYSTNSHLVAVRVG